MAKKLLIILVIALLVYGGFVFAPPLYHYYAFKSDLAELARIGGTMRQEDLMEKIMEKVREYNVPIDEDDIAITRMDHKVYIEASWQERVNFLNIYEKTFYFSIYTGE